jgi:Spy/CpxP family protein refolding chaperone
LRVRMTFSFKTSPFILSIAVLALGAVTVSTAANASSKSTINIISQASSPPAPASEPKVVLTREQKAQIDAVQSKSSEQIIALMTPEQKAVLQKAAQSSQASQSLEVDLKLTQEQKSKIAAIQAESRKQIQSILTPEQRQMLQKNSTPSP